MRCRNSQSLLLFGTLVLALFACTGHSIAQSQVNSTLPAGSPGMSPEVQSQTSQGTQSAGDQNSRSRLQPDSIDSVDQQDLQYERSLDSTTPSERRLTNRDAPDAANRRNLELLPPDKPTEFQRLVQTSVNQLLPIYAARLFIGAPSTFAPLDRVPVTPDYVIGPGDELLIQVWGQVSLDSRFTVDRAGNIFIRQVGAVHVAGLPFSQLQSQLKTHMSRVFRNFDLSVNMGQLRSIQIFVVGQARRPGSYTISSLSTLVDALFVTGGPSPQGSLRHIQLRRSGKVYVDFDLYDLLQRGDKSNDTQLLPGDVIYIPTVGPQVAIAGSVNLPAIYELKSSTGNTIKDGLDVASGVTNIASNTSARLERIDNHKMRGVTDLSLDPSGLALELRDGDILEVNSVTAKLGDGVILRGNVANPGQYAWHTGMHLKDLVPDKDALVTRDYWLRRGELGKPTLTYLPFCPPTPARTDERAPVANTVDSCVPLERSSTIERQMPQGQQTQGQLIQGQQASRSDSSEAYKSASGSTSAASALVDSKNSGFPTRNTVTLSAPDIDWSYAVIERQSTVDLTTSLIPFNLGRLMLDGDNSQNLELQAGDVITIFSKADVRVPQSQQTRFVRLEGEFNSAGIYSVRPGETLQQLVARAGGLTSDAYLYGSEFTRESTRRLQQQRLNEYIDQISLQASVNTTNTASRGINAIETAGAVAAQSQNQNIVASLRQARSSGRIVLSITPEVKDLSQTPPIKLEDGDTFIVPSVPSTVSVSGAVYNPNSFFALPHEELAKYLASAGGPTRTADSKHAYVIRADGSVVSRTQVSSFHRGSFNSLRMNPGDTIVVPLNIDRGAALRTVGDIAQIVGQFGLAIAAANILF